MGKINKRVLAIFLSSGTKKYTILATLIFFGLIVISTVLSRVFPGILKPISQYLLNSNEITFGYQFIGYPSIFLLYTLVRKDNKTVITTSLKENIIDYLLHFWCGLVTAVFSVAIVNFIVSSSYDEISINGSTLKIIQSSWFIHFVFLLTAIIFLPSVFLIRDIFFSQLVRISKSYIDRAWTVMIFPGGIIIPILFYRSVHLSQLESLNGKLLLVGFHLLAMSIMIYLKIQLTYIWNVPRKR